MSRPKSKKLIEKAALIEELKLAGRQHSGATVLLHQAVADRLGLNTTDHKCLEMLIRSEHPLTAGDLAEQTGLTTGAVTGLIDRLERAGFVRREADPEDRRRVFVQPVPENFEAVGRLFEPMAEAFAGLCADYSDQELALVLDFLKRSAAIVTEQTQRLRKSTP